LTLASPTPAPAWGPWVSLEHPATTALSTGAPVTTVPLQRGRFIAFGVGQDGQLHGRTWRGAAWGPWLVFGRPAAAALSTAAPVRAIAGAGDRFVLFATGQDGLLYMRSYTGARWNNWRQIGRPSGALLSTTAPVTARLAGGTISVYALGQDGALYMRAVSGGDWGPWVEFSRPAASTLATTAPVTVISRGRRHLALYATGQDGRLYVRVWVGRWRPWGVIDPPAGSVLSLTAPILTSNVTARGATLWAITQDGQLHQRAFRDGVWGAWQPFARPAEAPLSTSARIVTVPGGPLHYDVLSIAQDGQLFGRGWTSGTWGPWTAIGNPPTSKLSAGVTVGPGRFAVFAVGQDGGMYSIAP
jgi:hypothetical protein